MGGQVACRADHEYPGTPLAFTWQAQRLEVAEVIDQIRTPSGLIYLVRIIELGLFELSYEINTDHWSVRQI